MPPNYSLIEIKPNPHRRQGHDAQPSDEPSYPHSPRSQNNSLTHHRTPVPDFTSLTAVRPARTKMDPRPSTGS